MTLKEQEQEKETNSYLSQELDHNNENLFIHNESESINSQEKLQNENLNINKNTKDNKINIINNNENDSKVEASNGLPSSEIKNFILVESNIIKKQHIIVNEQNSFDKNHVSPLLIKRGRVKQSDYQSDNTKFSKDDIRKKIIGMYLNCVKFFINKIINDQSKKLKPISYKEIRNFNLNKKLKDIFENTSSKYRKDFNKNIIDICAPELKDIFELPMYKVIHHISGNHVVDILIGLEKEYFSLKAKKLIKKSEDYKKMFNIVESKLINSVINKYPIFEEIIKSNNYLK